MTDLLEERRKTQDLDALSYYDSAEEDDEEEVYVPDTSMDLSNAERAMALRIKQAVEADPDLDNLLDMEYAQHAMCYTTNNDDHELSVALERIAGMQAFKREYGVDGSADQGVFYLDQFMTLQPGSILNLDICEMTGEGIFALNRGAVDPSVALKCSSSDRVIEENWRIHAIGMYYLFHTVQPSLESCREGIFFLADGHDFGWKNINATFTRRLIDEVWWNYPFISKKVMEYNSNSIIPIFWSIFKPMMPKNFTTEFEFGCTIESDSTHRRTLSELYLQPNQEEAKVHLLKRAHELLSTRAMNEKSFKL